ncbi:hypothetical protein NDU88_003128 [Pleurodeles waltl]|uniref:Uncharacterized protein n=1 Tax=Pleurodeles waltl TaxID=8319 RepID=A0AAV7VEK5_PLEWA|nr:hypothetical protein NDU88_003128 [Pleurodeles waltl]
MLLKARAFRCQGEKTRHYGYAYSSSCASRFQGEETYWNVRDELSLSGGDVLWMLRNVGCLGMLTTVWNPCVIQVPDEDIGSRSKRAWTVGESGRVYICCGLVVFNKAHL